MRIEPGQFWRDTVNGDLLKILEMNEETITTGPPFRYGFGIFSKVGIPNERESKQVPYVKCGCIVNGEYFGVQEMQASHFEEDRFQLLAVDPKDSRWKQLRTRIEIRWYRWKYRKVGK